MKAEESEKAVLQLNIQKTKIMASSPIDGDTMETVTDFILGGSKITADEIKRRLLLGTKAVTKLDSIVKSRDITLLTKICRVKAMIFSVVICGCESWTIKKAEWQRINAVKLWCWRRLLRVPWTARRSNQSHPKGNQSWIFIGRLDAEAEAPILWPPDSKSQPIRKDPDVGKDWRQEKGIAEDEIVGWHQWLNGHEFEQTLGDVEGQGSLACCSPQGCKELDRLSN